MGSKQFAGGLGYVGPEEVAHRNNICLLLHHDHDDSGAGGAECMCLGGRGSLQASQSDCPFV